MIEARTERAVFLVEHLDLEKATGVDGARWEPFQIQHLNDDGLFRIENKARQIAWSFVVAAEAVAFALLKDPVASSSVFESINLSEAAQKISYARAVYESLRLGSGWPKLTKDTALSLEFDGGIDRGGSSIESLPARPPRGKARRNFYGDEFAHVKGDRDIYKAALPVTSKGGRFRLGSSPLGASGMFWEVFTQERQRYPGYHRKRTPWWHVFSFCHDVPAAVRNADQMTTRERVYTYGRPRIIAIYENMVEEDFQAEYECVFVDESTAWLTWDEIRACEDDELLCAQAIARQGQLADALGAVDAVARSITARTVEESFVGGLDIGRTRNTTELMLVGMTTTGHYPLRLHISMDALDFDSQMEVVSKTLSHLPVYSFLIDRNGLGMQLAEQLERRYPAVAKGVTFSNASKQLWATNLKALFQQRKVTIPVSRELRYQLHSIKRLITATKQLAFDTARDEKAHADMFWALALALTAAKPQASKQPEIPEMVIYT